MNQTKSRVLLDLSLLDRAGIHAEVQGTVPIDEAWRPQMGPLGFRLPWHWVHHRDKLPESSDKETKDRQQSLRQGFQKLQTVSTVEPP